MKPTTQVSAAARDVRLLFSEKRTGETLEHLLKMPYVAIFTNLRENENMGDAISQRRKCWTDLFGEL
jgi:hypothetical protein